jgi:hypothetical protein
MALRPGHRDVRLVDLRTGVLLRTGGRRSRLRTLRFVSAARHDAVGPRAEGSASHLGPGDPFTAPAVGDGMERRDRGEVRLARTQDPAGTRPVAVG